MYNNQYSVGTPSYNPYAGFYPDPFQGQGNNPPPSAPPSQEGVQGVYVPPPPPYAAVNGNANAYAYVVPPVAQYVLDSETHNKTEELLRKANEEASAILGRRREELSPFNDCVSRQYQGYHRPVVATAPVNITVVDNSWHSYGGWGWGWGWSRPQTVVHHHHYNNQAGNDRNQKGNDDTGVRILVGVVAFVVLGIGALMLGKAVAASENAQAKTETYAQLKYSWLNNKHRYPPQFRTTVDGIVEKVESIHKTQSRNRMVKTLLVISTLVAGGLAFYGAVAGAAAFMAAGTYVGGATLLVALFKLSYNAFSRKQINDAQAIDQGITALSKQQLIFV